MENQIITIVHFEDGCNVYTDIDCEHFAGCVAEQYARCWDKPNYPLPAKIEVKFDA